MQWDAPPGRAGQARIDPSCQAIVSWRHVRNLVQAAIFVADVFRHALRNIQKQQFSPRNSRLAHEFSMPLMPPKLIGMIRQGAYSSEPGPVP